MPVHLLIACFQVPQPYHLTANRSLVLHATWHVFAGIQYSLQETSRRQAWLDPGARLPVRQRGSLQNSAFACMEGQVSRSTFPGQPSKAQMAPNITEDVPMASKSGSQENLNGSRRSHR